MFKKEQYKQKNKISMYSIQQNIRNDCNKYNENSMRARRRSSDSLVEVNTVCESDSSDDAGGPAGFVDSGFSCKASSAQSTDILSSLEKKIDKLSELYLEQSRVLTTIKQDISNAKACTDSDLPDAIDPHILNDFMKKTLTLSTFQELDKLPMPIGCNKEAQEESYQMNPRARSLLDAIELGSERGLDRTVREALTHFLQSKELKEQIITATVKSLKSIIHNHLTQDLTSLYLPLLQRAHRRLFKQITKALEHTFHQLEQHSTTFSNSIYKTTKSLRLILEQHRNLLEERSDAGNNELVDIMRHTIEEILEKELPKCRENLLTSLNIMNETPVLADDFVAAGKESQHYIDYVPPSPPQPADSGCSLVDQLMKSAMITKLIKEGDINGSFERALSSSDLCLVMAACRSADPVRVFKPPCALGQHVLLSLVQQLTTDMLHDTYLKCRYIEEAIINLNPSHPATRAHLPTVVCELRTHLSKFLVTYPTHMAARRVTLIVMAASNLLK